MTKSRGIHAPRRAYSEFELAVMRMHYPSTITLDLAELFGRPITQVYRIARALGLAKTPEFVVETARERSMQPDHGARQYQFEKGHVPANKGSRRPGWTAGDMARTQFKAGRPASEARNYVPIGTHKLNKDGHLVRKITDDPSIVPARRWEAVHRLVWIETNGPIPAGHVIAFKPGQRTNVLEEITPDRVECLNLADNCRRNSFHNYGPEVSKVVQLRGAITRQINRRLKEKLNEQEHRRPARSAVRHPAGRQGRLD